ncbi:MAG: tRNA(His) guanylyltransferase Thg1 family protein [Candidimonas sp.]
MNDDLGDRMKFYERFETDRKFLPMLPIYARMDGRSFSRFSRIIGLKKPFDENMSSAMIETTKWLVEQTNAIIGYTQSDEISLIMYAEDFKSDIFFAGRVFKITSMLAAMASVRFNQLASQIWSEDKIAKLFPTFDARVFQMPNKIEAVNALVWRENDAAKNSISMAAQSMFSHNSLQGKSGKEMQEMMMTEKGINWNNYPVSFKRGTYVRRRLIERHLTEEEMARIPVSKRPESNLVKRGSIVTLDMPRLSKVSNKVETIFDDAEPLMIDHID